MRKFLLRLAIVAYATGSLPTELSARYVDGDNVAEDYSALRSVSVSSPTFCAQPNSILTMFGLAYDKQYAKLQTYRRAEIERGACTSLLEQPTSRYSSSLKRMSRIDNGTRVKIHAIYTMGMWLDRETGETAISPGFIVRWAGENDGGYF